MAQVYNNQLSAAEKNLSSSAQKGIQAAKDAYNAAKARGDTAGMAKANAQANAIRSANNLTTSKTGNDVVSKGTTSGSSGNKTSTSSTSTKRPSGSGSSGSSKVSSNINPNKITSSGNSSYKPSGGSSGNFNYSGSSGSSGGSSGKVVNVAPGGNAPAGTKVGDIVRTAGGDYMVVEPNTPNATRNPSNGLWSIKLGGPGVSTTTPTTQQPYTPQGTYQDQGLSAGDKAKVEALQAYYELRKSQGASLNELNSIHNQAQDIRANYGYSGGGDGSLYIPTKMPEDILPKQGLPVYEPQIEQTENVYNAARQKALAALQSAYDQSRLELEKYQAQIPGLYQQQANALSAQAERDRQRFNEYSAQSGLDAGSGSQAALAMQNQQQANMSQLRTAEANASAEAQSKLTELFTQYQNEIASALANNEYERAAALLAEYKQQAQSVVDVSQAQAQLDMNIANFNKDTRYTNWQKQMALAEAMAAQGNFSGYRALGMSEDDINSLRLGWLAQNPEAALNLGLASYR